MRKRNCSKRAARAGAPTGVLLVTSLAEAEGKTFFATALGRSVARARQRCLVIDCHFQRPGIERALSPVPAKGVPTPASYPQIQVDKPSGLHYVVAPALEQRRIFRAQDLFESAEMNSYILRMRSHYDLVILDAPPLPAVSDLAALSRLADATIFLIRWGRTPRQAALNGLRLLRARRTSLAGVVLSRVDLPRYATYGYRDYVRYLRSAAGPAPAR
jgi:polysaccharide biosynthesis transport protein